MSLRLFRLLDNVKQFCLATVFQIPTFVFQTLTSEKTQIFHLQQNSKKVKYIYFIVSIVQIY